MKKSIKIILLITALLTVALVITAITMLKAVSGDALLYMNSKLGSFYAHSYRWFCLASIVMVLFWVVFAIVKRKVIAGSFAKRKEKKQEGKTEEEKKEVEKKEAGKTEEEKRGIEKKEAEKRPVVKKKETEDAVPKENASSKVQNATSNSKVQGEGKAGGVQEKKSKFCANCGKQISGNDKFCGFCGGVVKVFDGPENVESLKDAKSPEDVENLKDAESPKNVPEQVDQ